MLGLLFTTLTQDTDLVFSIYYYTLINDTVFELHVFWSFDTKRRTELAFSESVSQSLKTKLMTLQMMALLNTPQETSNVPNVITFKNEISLEEKVYKRSVSRLVIISRSYDTLI